ncbi:MAG: hypothetical protein D6766_02915 [Verrucomicrobia bacterium]|nr:MAG: hypothetical protein D6766_02915 [Verrucomicrobiota bacterium]
MWLAWAALCAGRLDGAPANAAGLSAEHVALMEFLTNRPPIKRVEFDLSYNRIFPEEPPDPPFVRVRASLQPGGFYFQFPTPYPFRTPYTKGESADYYWGVTSNVVSLAPKSGPGADPKNGTQIVVENERKELEELLQFGLEEAAPGSIHWLTPTNFVASTRPLKNGERLRLTGRLILDRDGRPKELRYQDAERRAIDIVVRYRYEERGAVLPKTTIVQRDKSIIRPHPGQRLMTNILVSLEPGVVPEAAQGFTPSMFIGEQDPPRELLINSNGVRYVVTELGMIRNEGVEPPAYALVTERPGAARYGGLVVTVALACGFVWWLGKRRRQPTTPNQKS